ncbi:hypothetical protein GOP47_0016322 [Adiantum capillus-veneris]|uniref:16S rRNA (cytosine(967)-C(5))-methyltransferase n=1 Tax=Adiantum capillus-veneris TaxID=13818 RepID=A0A9D4UHX0_ADICA|nr:hypothetical protein GOP47_0016322 [Adiantum capillus-veneris]
MQHDTSGAAIQAWKQDMSGGTAIPAWDLRASLSGQQRACSRVATQLRKPPSCRSPCAPLALLNSTSRSPAQPQRQFPLRSEVSNYRAFSVVRLLRIEQGGAYADVLSGDGDHTWERELDYVARTLGFQTSALDPRGQRQVTEIVAGITRWKRHLDFLIKAYYDVDGYDRMEPLLRQILRLGVYELVKMETAPHAAINETVKLGKYSLRHGAGNLVNGLLRSISRHKDNGTLLTPKVKGDDRSQARALADLHSHPVWMIRRWMSRFGKDETIKLMEWNNKPPTYGLRANFGRGFSREALLEKLKDIDVMCEPSSVLEDFIRVSSGMQAVIQGGLLQKGLCSVQDESGGLVVKVVDPQPGEIIVDCCAAPGGKALFMAACLKNQGKVIAIDIHKGKMKLLQEAARHLGVEHVVTTELSDLCSFVDKRHLSADKVLVDVPCSGLGVLSKRADLRWRKTVEDFDEMVRLQSILLSAAAQLVKPGGVLVYSTCSIEAEENAELVFHFLKHHPEFTLESVEGYVPSQFVTLDGFFASLPHRHHMDGAFAARLQRKY